MGNLLEECVTYIYKLITLKSMRVVSLVPSWTETLLVAGVDVIGRSRFCIHPKAQVKTIPKVGGTKDWNWQKILDLKPDLIILDREENPKFMADQTEIETLSTHVRSIHDMPEALEVLATRLSNERLGQMAQEWIELIHPDLDDDVATPLDPQVDLKIDLKTDLKIDLSLLPGVISWERRPSQPINKIVYVIWRDPWMRVGRLTFIGSVLKHIGVGDLLDEGPELYPKFELKDYTPASTLFLFSSEPYPFLRYKLELAALDFPHAFVDGEKFSWFGDRAFQFLTKA